MISDQLLGNTAPGRLLEVSAPLVDVRDLTLRLVSHDMDLTLLHGVSFALRPGEVLCLVGEFGIRQERHVALSDVFDASDGEDRGRD